MPVRKTPRKKTTLAGSQRNFRSPAAPIARKGRFETAFQEVWDRQDSALVGELVVALILGSQAIAAMPRVTRQLGRRRAAPGDGASHLRGSCPQGITSSAKAQEHRRLRCARFGPK